MNGSRSLYNYIYNTTDSMYLSRNRPTAYANVESWRGIMYGDLSAYCRARYDYCSRNNIHKRYTNDDLLEEKLLADCYYRIESLTKICYDLKAKDSEYQRNLNMNLRVKQQRNVHANGYNHQCHGMLSNIGYYCGRKDLPSDNGISNKRYNTCVGKEYGSYQNTAYQQPVRTTNTNDWIHHESREEPPSVTDVRRDVRYQRPFGTKHRFGAYNEKNMSKNIKSFHRYSTERRTNPSTTMSQGHQSSLCNNYSSGHYTPNNTLADALRWRGDKEHTVISLHNRPYGKSKNFPDPLKDDVHGAQKSIILTPSHDDHSVKEQQFQESSENHPEPSPMIQNHDDKDAASQDRILNACIHTNDHTKPVDPGQTPSTDDNIPYTVIPVPLSNPRGYCFFNSVVQVLRGCLEFTSAVIKYHQLNRPDVSPGTNSDHLFVTQFCKMIYEMTHGPKEQLNYSLRDVHQHFEESKDGDDVQKCFMVMLTRINNVTRTTVDKPVEGDSKAAEAFNKHKNKNNGFIFDLFYGQMCCSTTCRICKLMVKESFQLFKTLPLPIPSCTGGVDLMDCVRCFLEEAEIIMEERLDCRCEGGSVEFYSQCTITHSPMYLFIYLNRGSYFEGGLKDNTFVKCGEMIKLPTTGGEVQYRLISVIDHIGDNEGGHYYCRCNYESNHWWLISDEQVDDLGSDADNVITEYTIVLMYKRSS